MPAWISCSYQHPENFNFDGIFWNPFVFRHSTPNPDCGLLISECHIRMAGVEARIRTYKEVTRDVRPNGYNAFQVMALMEHVDFASFGYQITSLFLSPSRFGSADDLTAHSMGILVFRDLVHLHPVRFTAPQFHARRSVPLPAIESAVLDRYLPLRSGDVMIYVTE
jgi:1,4-alpha-glucan branching enzyme